MSRVCVKNLPPFLILSPFQGHGCLLINTRTFTGVWISRYSEFYLRIYEYSYHILNSIAYVIYKEAYCEHAHFYVTHITTAFYYSRTVQIQNNEVLLHCAEFDNPCVRAG
jgi:hypothetical protein